MPRKTRIYLPGMPYHIVQRGNNREACFMRADNYLLYLSLWEELSSRYGVAVHAYCLMTNHIHFLVTPSTETAISRTMSVVGSRYAFAINKQLGRTGTIWEGRHKSSLVDSDQYLLTCYRYIELNPVRAEIVTHPSEYPWSSFAANAYGNYNWLEPHPIYLALSTTLNDRLANYRSLFADQLEQEDLEIIRTASHYCHPIGDQDFKAMIELEYGVNLGHAKRGRPLKPTA